MAQVMVNLRMDAELKSNMEQVCNEMGFGLTTAFTIFAKKVSRERRIPFEVTAEPDPFYSIENIKRLHKAIDDAKAGRNMTEHELIETDND